MIKNWVLLCQWLEDAWEAIDQDKIRHIILSTRRSLTTVAK